MDAHLLEGLRGKAQAFPYHLLDAGADLGWQLKPAEANPAHFVQLVHDLEEAAPADPSVCLALEACCLGRNLRHLVNTIHDLMERGICFRVLTGQGANIDTTTASGRLVFGIFAALAEFERELIRERTIAGLSSARARGRNGGRPYTMTPAKLRMAQAAMAKRDTRVSDLCKELGVTRQTLYRFVGPKGQLRADGTKLLKRNAQNGRS